MPNLLKPRQYFSLTYSVIPDNKIKQVVGNYEQTNYDQSEQVLSNTYSNYTYTYVDGHTGTGNLPMYDQSDQDYYEDTFHEEVTYERSTSYGYETANRTEKVAVLYTFTIRNELPFEFDSAILSEVTGFTYTDIGTNQTDTDTFWTYFSNETNKLYAPFCINTYSSGHGRSSSTTELTTGEIKSILVDNRWNGKALDGDTYRMDLYIQVYVVNNELYRHESSAGISATISQSLIHSFKIEATILEPTTEQVDFDYHLTDADYKDYSLTVNGNEYTNSNTIYSIEESDETTEISWAAWISNSILDKYRNGKIFINAKVKLSYLIENDIDINSELYVKDINNNYLSRVIDGELEYCVFRVKNVEYICNDTVYNANVVLLEERTEQPSILVAFDSRICVLDLSGINIQGITIHPVDLKMFASIENNFEVTATSDAIIDMDHAFVFSYDMDTQAIDNVSTQYIGELAAVEGSILSEVIDNTNVQLELNLKGLGTTMNTDAIDNAIVTGAITNKLYTYANYDAHYKVDLNFNAFYALYYQFDSYASQIVKTKPNRLCLGVEVPNVVASSHDTIDTLLIGNTVYYNNEINALSHDVLDFDYEGDTSYVDVDNHLNASTIHSVNALLNNIQLGLKSSMSCILRVDRPIDDVHFFNLSISQWIDLSIEDMLEIIYNS